MTTFAEYLIAKTSVASQPYDPNVLHICFLLQVQYCVTDCLRHKMSHIHWYQCLHLIRFGPTTIKLSFELLVND